MAIKNKALKPDDDGYYRVMLGKTEDFKYAGNLNDFITGCNSSTRIMIGERGTPSVSRSLEYGVRRMHQVNTENRAVYYNKAFKALVPSLGEVLFADAKPTGPYAREVKEILEEGGAMFGLRGLSIDGLITGIISFDLIAFSPVEIDIDTGENTRK